VEIEELGGVAGRFGELASEVARPPTRLIKTIGDAAMFVSSEPGPLVETALSFIEAAERAELPALRAGIAFGAAAQRAGDYFGHSVNLASRVTGAARPGSVLCTRDVRDAAGDDFDWSSAGRFRFKGVAEPEPLYRARRLETASSPRSGRRRKRAGS
jgi:adenylate cyclase